MNDPREQSHDGVAILAPLVGVVLGLPTLRQRQLSRCGFATTRVGALYFPQGRAPQRWWPRVQHVYAGAAGPSSLRVAWDETAIPSHGAIHIWRPR
jgi:hypothetical protein